MDEQELNFQQKKYKPKISLDEGLERCFNK